MAFGVFIHRPDSIYDDSPAERYQFPRPYLGRVQACVGDWIIYYEPRKLKGTRGYYAIARVQQVIPDPAASGMYVAIIEPGSYLDEPPLDSWTPSSLNFRQGGPDGQSELHRGLQARRGPSGH